MRGGLDDHVENTASLALAQPRIVKMDDFWKHKSLEDMTRVEWESLCDGCARCCLAKIVDEDQGRVDYTAAHCELLDSDKCRCTRYDQRTQLVAQCVELTPEVVRRVNWLPDTCAYRLLAEGKELPEWHPLVSKDRNSTFEAGISIRGRTVPLDGVHPDCLEEMVVTWVNA